jgi:hypothetical protein
MTTVPPATWRKGHNVSLFVPDQKVTNTSISDFNLTSTKHFKIDQGLFLELVTFKLRVNFVQHQKQGLKFLWFRNFSQSLGLYYDLTFVFSVCYSF